MSKRFSTVAGNNVTSNISEVTPKACCEGAQ